MKKETAKRLAKYCPDRFEFDTSRGSQALYFTDDEGHKFAVQSWGQVFMLDGKKIEEIDPSMLYAVAWVLNEMRVRLDGLNPSFRDFPNDREWGFLWSKLFQKCIGDLSDDLVCKVYCDWKECGNQFRKLKEGEIKL